MKPVIGITIGDPAGIGPEILIKALSRKGIFESCKPIIIGDLNLLKMVSKKLNKKIVFKKISDPSEIEGKKDTLEIIDLENIDVKNLRIGKISKEAGRAALEYIEKSVYYALRKKIDALVTAPINKESIHLAGSAYIGHTELITALSGAKGEPLTMFLVRGVRIFFLTRHLPLSTAIEAVKKKKIIETSITINNLLFKIGIEKPKIAIAALNPHASDGGLIGNEEKREIIPAIHDLQGKGINAVGPVPADSVFYQALSGKYDAVLSLYHDQGHIAAKTVDFYGTVSATLGLPFIRTSVDHGTAFDIAGKGMAESKSMEEAIHAAIDLASHMKK